MAFRYSVTSVQLFRDFRNNYIISPCFLYKYATKEQSNQYQNPSISDAPLAVNSCDLSPRQTPSPRGKFPCAQKYVEQWKKFSSSLLPVPTPDQLESWPGHQLQQEPKKNVRNKRQSSYDRIVYSTSHNSDIRRHITRPFVCKRSRPFIFYTLRPKSPLSYLIQ